MRGRRSWGRFRLLTQGWFLPDNWVTVEVLKCGDNLQPQQQQQQQEPLLLLLRLLLLLLLLLLLVRVLVVLLVLVLLLVLSCYSYWSSSLLS